MDTLEGTFCNACNLTRTEAYAGIVQVSVIDGDAPWT